MEATGIRSVTYPNENQVFKIYDLADIHWGNVGCAKDHFRQDVKKIRSEDNALVVEVGDYCDWISPQDPRFDPECLDHEISVADLSRLSAKISGMFIQEIQPIADKILGFGLGNHEFQYMRRRSEMQVHDTICNILNVPNMGYSGWMVLYFVHDPEAEGISMRISESKPSPYVSKLKLMAHHGKGAANTVGGKVNSLRDIVELAYDADIVMTGHLHESTVKPFVRLTTDERCLKLKNKICFGMATGSYLRNYVPGIIMWGETRGFRLSMLGCINVEYSPKRHSINDVAL